MISIALFVSRGLYLCGRSRSVAVSYDILLFFSDQHQPRPSQLHSSFPAGRHFLWATTLLILLFVLLLVMWRGSILGGRLLPLFCQKPRSIYLHVSVKCNTNKFLTTAIRISIVCDLILVWSNVLQVIQTTVTTTEECIIVTAGAK